MQKQAERALSRPKVQLILDVAREAERIVRARLAAHPGYADQLNLLGLIQMENGQVRAAVSSFLEALERNPRYRAARSSLGHAYLGLGCQTEALEAFEALVQQEPFEVRSRLDVSAWHAARGEHDLAADCLRGEAAKEDAAPTVLHRLGLLEMELGRVEAAAAAFRRARDRSTFYVDEYRECRLFGEEPLSQEGVETLRARFEANHNRAELLQFYGHLYARYGMVAEARDAYSEARRHDPDEAGYFLNLAHLATVSGAAEDALEFLVRAVETDPKDARARIALGFDYSLQGQVEEAIAQFEVAAKLRPSYPDVHYNLGLLYCAQDRFEDAVRELRQAIRLNAGYRPARNQLAYALRRLGDDAQALEEYRRTLSSGLRSSDIYLNAGILHLSLGQLDSAIEALKAALDANPRDPLPCYHLGLAYQRRGQRRRARAAWRRFLTLAREFESAGRGIASPIGGGCES